VGKHVRRFLYLEPGAKPRHRFVIALGTIVLLAFGAMAVVAAIYPENDPAVAQPDGNTLFSVEPGDPGPPIEADPTLPPTDAPPGAPTGLLLGIYTVPASNIWATGFQAQIAMTNTTAAPQTWQVRLHFPQSVTAFTGSWVDGQPQPGIEAVDQDFTFTGGMPVPPGQTVVLKVQFEKTVNADFRAQECVINGRACSIG
jgi:Cellulose binding domain